MGKTTCVKLLAFFLTCGSAQAATVTLSGASTSIDASEANELLKWARGVSAVDLLDKIALEIYGSGDEIKHHFKLPRLDFLFIPGRFGKAVVAIANYPSFTLGAREKQPSLGLPLLAGDTTEQLFSSNSSALNPVAPGLPFTQPLRRTGGGLALDSQDREQRNSFFATQDPLGSASTALWAELNLAKARTIDLQEAPAVPEPSPLPSLGVGALLLLGRRKIA